MPGVEELELLWLAEDVNDLRDVAIEYGATQRTVEQVALGASITPASVIRNKVRRGFTASITPSATVADSGTPPTTHTLTGSSTPSAAVPTRSIAGDFLSATIIPSASLQAEILSTNTMSLGAVMQPSSTVRFRVRKSVSAVSAPFANVGRRLKLALQASITPASGVSLTVASPGAVYTQTLTGEVTPSGALTRFRVAHTLAASIQPASSLLQRPTSIQLAAQVQPSATLAIYQPPPPPVIANLAQLILVGGDD